MILRKLVSLIVSISRFIFVVSVKFDILIGRDNHMFDMKALILQFTRNFLSSIGNKDRQYNWHLFINKLN